MVLTDLLLIVVFITAMLVFLGGYLLIGDLLSDRFRVQERVSQEFGLGTPGAAPKSALFRDLDQLSPELMSGAVAKPGWRTRLEMMLEQSGLFISFQQLVMFGLFFAVLCGILAGMLKGSWLVGGAVALVGFCLPVVYVRSRWRARLEKLRGQLPEAFEFMSRIIRAGQTMPQAILGAAQEFEPPLSRELAQCYDQQNLGLSFETALRELAHRTGLLEIKILVMGLLVQQETGGNLAVLLDGLADMVRNRLQVREKVRVLTAEGRAQAVALISLPFVAFLLMFFLNREYAMKLVESPNLLSGMLVSMCLGALWIRKIINIDF
jgi:tight adherence protein B